MAKVRRQNVVLTIKDEDVKHYIDLGYKVIDDFGNVIAGEEPDYKQLYFQEREKVLALEEKLKKLTVGEEEVKAEVKEEPKVEAEAEPEVKPKRRSRKSQNG